MSDPDMDDTDDPAEGRHRPPAHRKSMNEEFHVAAGELMDRLKTLLEEGRVRRITVRAPSGELYFEIPATAGIIGGAALAMAAPFLAMAGGLGNFGSDVRLQVDRDEEGARALEGGVQTIAQVGAGIAAAAQAVTRAVRGNKAPAPVRRLAGKAAPRTSRAAAPAAKRAVGKVAAPQKKAPARGGSAAASASKRTAKPAAAKSGRSSSAGGARPAPRGGSRATGKRTPRSR